MRSCSLYHDDDCIEVECFKFCIMPILRDELHWTARLRNLHQIQPSTNLESPSIWQAWCIVLSLGSVRYKELIIMVDIVWDKLDLADERCCYLPQQSGCSDKFTWLAEIIMRGKELTISSHTWRANNFVCYLTWGNRQNLRDPGHA